MKLSEVIKFIWKGMALTILGVLYLVLRPSGC